MGTAQWMGIETGDGTDGIAHCHRVWALLRPAEREPSVRPMGGTQVTAVHPSAAPADDRRYRTPLQRLRPYTQPALSCHVERLVLRDLHWAACQQGTPHPLDTPLVCRALHTDVRTACELCKPLTQLSAESSRGQNGA